MYLLVPFVLILFWVLISVAIWGPSVVAAGVFRWVVLVVILFSVVIARSGGVK